MHVFSDLLQYRNILSSLNPAIKSYVKKEGPMTYILQGTRIIDITFLNRYLKYEVPKDHRSKIIGVMYPRYVTNVIFEIDNLILNAYSNINSPLIAYPGSKYEIIVSESRTNLPCRDIMRINIAPFHNFSFIIRWRTE